MLLGIISMLLQGEIIISIDVVIVPHISYSVLMVLMIVSQLLVLSFVLGVWLGGRLDVVFREINKK